MHHATQDARPEGACCAETEARGVTASGATRPGHGRTSCRAPAATPPQRDQSKKSEEIVNYEVSRTTKTEVTEGGRIKRVSAAVLVDGSYARNDKGDVVYQPRSKEELDRIAALVRSAIGFDQKRGDQVEVVNLRFAEAPEARSWRRSGWVRPAVHQEASAHGREFVMAISASYMGVRVRTLCAES